MAAATQVSSSLLATFSSSFAVLSRTQNLEGFSDRSLVRAARNGAGAGSAFVIGLGSSSARATGIGIGSGVGLGQSALSLRYSYTQDRRYLPGFLKMSTTEAVKRRVNDPQLAVNEGKDAALSAREGLKRRVNDPQLAKTEGKDAAVKTKNYVSAQLAKPGVKSLVVAVAIPLILGSVDAFFNSPSSQWFKDLKKPWWEPPGPIFGGAWSILYPLMGLASWLVWADGGFHKNSNALTLYISQLVLNLLWPLFFFGWKNLGLALVDIVALVGVLGATIKAFQPVNHVAANLMKPYLAWVLFATLLNLNLWWSNRGGSPEKQAA